jgi:hypothetical protein
MPPYGGARTPVSYSWGDWGKPSTDITQFKDVFQPDKGTFAPGYPLVPTTPERVRVWDFPIGYNTLFTPRSYERITFAELRALAENHDITRLAIETRKDQIEKLEWAINARDENDVSTKSQAAIAKLTDFWRCPDGDLPFAAWLRKALEEVLVLDALAFEIRRTRGGEIIGLDVIDGSSIKVLLDDTGRWPKPPAPAFLQVIHGRPWALLTTDQLLYAPRNRRAHKAFGQSPVEQIIVAINIGLRREMMQLQHFTESNVPPGLLNAPDGWNPQQVQQFQEWFDSILAGNTGQRTRLVWGPAGAKYQAFKEAPFKDLFDEWLARIVCYAFSLPPTPFLDRAPNRSSSETMQEAAIEEGLAPLMGYVKRLADYVIQRVMGYPDLEFAWNAEQPVSPEAQAVNIDKYLRNGTISWNEARDQIGLEPIEGGNENAIILPNGPVLVKDMVAISTLAANPPEPPPAADKPVAGGSPAKKAAARTLYVSRQLKNAGEFRTWAKEQGFAKTLAPADIHVTIAFSKTALDWDAVGNSVDEIRIPASANRSVEPLGDKGAVVLRFTSKELTKRWQQIRDAGASWDHPGYKPHISITYDAGEIDLDDVEPFTGELVFGPERFAEVEDDWDEKITEAEVSKGSYRTFHKNKAARRAHALSPSAQRRSVDAAVREVVDREAADVLRGAGQARRGADRAAPGT